MKLRKKFVVLISIMLILSSGSQAFAIDVAAGVTEVDVPITITSAETTPSSGFEVRFRCSEGLTPIEVVISRGHPELSFSEIGFHSDDNTYDFGVYSEDNAINLSNGKIDVCSIKCSFTGNGTSTLTFEDVIIFRINERNAMEYEYIEGGYMPTPITVNRTGGTGVAEVVQEMPETAASAEIGEATPSAGIDSEGILQNGLAGGASGTPAGANGPIITAEGKMTFNDLVDADWAREAIEYLATFKGILGTGYGMFTPNANVTRAQFARFLGQAFSLQGTGANASFADVTAADWFYGDVMKLVSLGIIKGYDSSNFGPNDLISREQMATMVDRTLEYFGFSLSAYGVVTMADIYTTADYSRLSVQRLFEAGLINGMGDNAFYPQSYTTRGQSAAVIYKALIYAGKR